MDSLIIFCAKYLVFIIPLILVAIFFQLKGRLRWQFALGVVLAAVLGLVLSKLSGLVYFHHRPFIVQNIQPLVAHGDDNGFPSDHTLLATALASVIYFYKRQIGYIAFGLALVVGIARVLAHVHWPVDIFGGLFIGVIAGWAGYFLAKKLLPSDKHFSITKELDSRN